MQRHIINEYLLLSLLKHGMLCSLLVWHKFGRGQHQYTLLRWCIKVYVDAGQPLSAGVWGTS